MNLTEFAAQIQLHPRAIPMLGTLTPRMKNGETLPGTTPHYAMPNCPVVHRNGNVAVEEPNAAEIEALFQETAFPMPSALLAYSPKQGNLLQLMFGRNGQGPTQAAYRVLFEAAAKLNVVLQSKRQVFAVTLPILTPGQYGVVTGRHYLLGLFETDGTPIWIHPDAVAQNVFKAEFPADQHERSTAAEQAPAAQAAIAWYETMKTALAVTGLQGQTLHETILKARANQLVEQGAAPTVEAGLALAALDAPKPSEAPAASTTTPKAAGPKKGPSQAQETGKKLLKKK